MEDVPDKVLLEIEGSIPAADKKLKQNGKHITCTATYDGEPVEVEFTLSEVVVSVAEYEDEENATATTSPKSTERVHVYIRGGVPDDSEALVLNNNNSAVLPEEARKMWERAINIEYQEDFICATGHDDADPVGNQFDAYWVMTKVETDEETVWEHPKR